MNPRTRLPVMLTLTAAAGAAAMVSTGLAGGAGGAEDPRLHQVPAQTRTVNAVETIAFAKKRLTAAPGRVTLISRNRTPLRHNIAVRGKGLPKPVKGKVVDPGGVSRVTVTLKPGTYTFFCSVGGHAAAGMKGTLTVSR